MLMSMSDKYTVTECYEGDYHFIKWCENSLINIFAYEQFSSTNTTKTTAPLQLYNARETKRFFHFFQIIFSVVMKFNCGT